MAAVGSPLNLRNQIPIHPLQSSTPSSSSSSSSLHTLHLFKLPKPPLNPINFTPRKPLRHLPTSLNPNPEPQTAKETQAQQAIEEYLLKMGALSEDASSISLNCPDYVKTLIDGVNDLDEWNSWKGDFKNKVYAMVEEKGDKGVLALLESLGLSLSSATYLAQDLSSSSSGSNKLLMLIQKVKYVKDIFFSGSNDGSGEVMGRNARRMMANLSISADEDLQQTLAFLEKIQARRGGLDLLDSECASLPYLIESFPLLLLKSVESRVEPIFKFLEDIGVAKGHMRNILLLYPPILCFDVDKDIKPRLRVYEKVGLRDNDLGKMVVKYPWILSACILENFDKMVDFLDKEKVPRLSSSEAIRNWPQILGCSVDKMKLTVDQFSDIGISNKKLGHIIAKSPQLLLCRHHEFEQMVTFFKGLGLDEEAIARTLKRCPEIFVASIDKTLAKKVEFLSVVGISKSHLPRVIRKYPDLLVCDVDKALRPRVRYFMKIGLTKNQIVSMVRRFSPLLGYSIEGVLKPKVEFLVNKMEKPLRDVVEYPRYFSYSLEKRIKPRYWVMKSRNIEINLKEMLGKNDEEFASDYLDV